MNCNEALPKTRDGKQFTSVMTFIINKNLCKQQYFLFIKY